MENVKINHVHHMAPTKTNPIDVILLLLALFVATALGILLAIVHIHREQVHHFSLYRATELEKHDGMTFTLVLKGEKGYSTGDRVWAIGDTITTMATDRHDAMPYNIIQIIEDKD